MSLPGRRLRRPGRGAVAAVLVSWGLVVLLLVQASAFVPVDPGPWPGARSVAVQPLAAYPLPLLSGHGRRVVYSETSMHVWA